MSKLQGHILAEFEECPFVLFSTLVRWNYATNNTEVSALIALMNTSIFLEQLFTRINDLNR